MAASRAITDAELAALVDSLRVVPARDGGHPGRRKSKRLQSEIEAIMVAKAPAASASEAQAPPKRRARAKR